MDAAARKLKLPRPKVIDYHDYRLFLKDWFNFLATQDPDFSLRKLARESKVGVSFISMMLNGHRGLSQVMLERLNPHLQLNEREIYLLSLLRGMAEAETPEVREKVFAQIQKRPEYRSRHPKEFETFHYLSAWFFVAIREMASLPDFQFDAHWIQKHLRQSIPLEDINRCLTFLESHGFIQRQKPHVPDKNLDCMGGVFTMALASFHKQMLQQTANAIDAVPRDERLILGHTFAFPKAKADEVKKILTEALKKIEELPATESDTVYHVTLAAIPLTKKVKASHEE